LPDDVEAVLKDMLGQNFIRPGAGARRKDAAKLAKNAYASRSPEEMWGNRFCAWARFVDRFLARNDSILRKMHPERRTQIDSTQVRWFLDVLEIAKTRYDVDRLFALDKTCWKCCMMPIRGLAEKGTETVKLNKSRDKESDTAYRHISGPGHKLPY
jgi:hypothetical protein